MEREGQARDMVEEGIRGGAFKGNRGNAHGGFRPNRPFEEGVTRSSRQRGAFLGQVLVDPQTLAPGSLLSVLP